MTKRRTIEIIIETEELLVVNKLNRTASLKCPDCGALIESQKLVANADGHGGVPYDEVFDIRSSESSLENGEASAVHDNLHVAAFPPVRRLAE